MHGKNKTRAGAEQKGFSPCPDCPRFPQLIVWLLCVLFLGCRMSRQTGQTGKKNLF